ncbi:MAG: helix-turn-helix domain-containing protein [Candidatus Cloacimonetes bacterium]|nr:helix-turn-helix domain-containing protein [Candidatus Cloacimonadota bacterium]
MSLGERLQQLLLKLDLSQIGLARALGTSNVVVNRYINNKTMPDYNFLRKLGSSFRVNINWLLTGDGPIFAGEEITNIGNRQYYNLPVIAAVSCGSPQEVLEAEAEDFLMVDSRSLPGDFSNYFAFYASGDSMAPCIGNGDVVVVKRHEDWQTADDRICVVWIDGEITLKKVTLFSDGQEILLSPYNKEYSPLLLNGDSASEAHLIGIAIMAVKNL